MLWPCCRQISHFLGILFNFFVHLSGNVIWKWTTLYTHSSPWIRIPLISFIFLLHQLYWGNRPTHVYKYRVYTWVCWYVNRVVCNLTIMANDNRYLFTWSHGWCLKDVSGKAMRFRDKGYFCGDVVVCDVLWNGGIIQCAPVHITKKGLSIASWLLTTLFRITP